MTLFRVPKWLQVSTPLPMRLGIDGLSPLTTRLENGGSYVVAVDNATAGNVLLLSTVNTALADGIDCCVVCRDPHRLSTDLQRAGLDVDGMMQAGKLRLLQWLPDTAMQLQHFGHRRFLSELEDIELPRHSLLMVDDSDAMFLEGIPARQSTSWLSQLKRWLQDWQLAGVFLLRSDVLDAPESLFRQPHRFIAGVGEFRHDLGRYRWRILHWRSAEGTVVDSEYHVHASQHDAGLIAIQPEDVDAPAATGQVFYTAETLAGDEALPGDWICCRDYDEMVDQIDRLASASVILHYRQPSEFTQLAQTVHQIRYHAGRHMHIVIRERGVQLRYSQELLLTRLGANQIVYLEFGVSRLLRAVESAMNQRFSGYIEEDFKTALTAAMPAEECGYLPPQRFCELVKATLSKTQAIDMHHVLVRLDLLPEMAHLDVLLKCQPRRANDVVTADPSHIYVFLFACRESDVDAALRRIILEPLDQMFSGQSFWSGRWNLLDQLETLQEQSRLHRLADFSLVLPAIDRSHTDNVISPVDSALPGKQRQQADRSEPDAAIVSKPARTASPFALKLKQSS